MNRARSKNRVILFTVTATIALLGLYLVVHFGPLLRELLRGQMGGLASKADTVVDGLLLFFLGILTYLFVRALNNFIFGLVFKLRRGFEAPTLVRNIFSIVAFTALFLIIF